MNEFRLVQTDKAFGQRVVVAVTHAAHRRLDAFLNQPLAVADRHVLRAPVAVMDQGVRCRAVCPQSLLQRIQHEHRLHGATEPPADDMMKEHIDDEGDMHESLPGEDTGEIGHPQLIRTPGITLGTVLEHRAYSALGSLGETSFSSS